MKLIVIGSGQCGNRIADEFIRMNGWVKRARGIQVIMDAFAVNTDEADLSGLRYMPRDYNHRIILGAQETGGHGVGKLNEVAVELAKKESQKITDAINSARNFFEVDAFLVTGSGGGGTGSGSVPVIVERIKQQYDKPVYALIVLPYSHEELNEERSRLNTAACLKATYKRADAVFLVDNERYANFFGRVPDNYDLINKQIVGSFRDILCSGEERKRKWVGGKVVDAGDIKVTLQGWTAIGWGGFDVPLLRDLWKNKSDYLKKSGETRKGIGAIEKALHLLSVKCSTEEFQEAQNALLLFTAPKKEMNLDIVKEGEGHLKDLMPDAMIRAGDYPREKGTIEATVILSKIGRLKRIEDVYTKGGDEYRERQEENLRKYKEAKEAIKKLGDQVPDLF